MHSPREVLTNSATSNFYENLNVFICCGSDHGHETRPKFRVRWESLTPCCHRRETPAWCTRYLVPCVTPGRLQGCVTVLVIPVMYSHVKEQQVLWRQRRTPLKLRLLRKPVILVMLSRMQYPPQTRDNIRLKWLLARRLVCALGT